MIDMLASFLNDTRYSLVATRPGLQETKLLYRLRAFADPIY